MNQAVHSPGPWGIDHDSHESIGEGQIYAGHNLGVSADEPLRPYIRIARMSPYSSMSQEEADANALLIKAAPDLLAAEIAQEEAEDFHHNHCPEADDHGEDKPELCEHCFPLFDKARCMRRAAIANARGEKQ